jgi:hypothetical protein
MGVNLVPIPKEKYEALRISEADALMVRANVRWFTCPPVALTTTDWQRSPAARQCGEHLRDLALMRLRDDLATGYLTA